MALIKCKECGTEISDQAKKCPKCGVKTEKAIKKSKYIKIFSALALTIIIIIAVIIIVKVNDPIHQYSREAIMILEDYKEDKITAEKAAKKLDEISYEAKEKSYEEENDTSRWYLLSVKISAMSTSIELEKADVMKINNYIKELKDF